MGKRVPFLAILALAALAGLTRHGCHDQLLRVRDTAEVSTG